jgi:hypothetical protein
LESEGELYHPSIFMRLGFSLSQGLIMRSTWLEDALSIREVDLRRIDLRFGREILQGDREFQTED